MRQRKPTAGDAAADDNFGRSISISGDMDIVGACRDDGNDLNSGSVCIFRRDCGGTNNWGQVDKPTASDAVRYNPQIILQFQKLSALIFIGNYCLN